MEYEFTQAEKQAIIKAGGTVWRVDREVPNVAAHKSENGISQQFITGTFKNYSDSLDELDAQVQQWGKFLVAKYGR